MAGISGNLNIDNLHNHSANLIDINGEIESGNVILTYDLDDPNNDILDIIFRYRLEKMKIGYLLIRLKQLYPLNIVIYLIGTVKMISLE